MQIVDAATTRAQLPFSALIPALREAFARGCEAPLRHTHRIEDDSGTIGTVLVMPAWRAGARFGLKTVMIFPGNGALGKPGLHSTYQLFDARTGEPLALLDGDEITTRRTAAASALAASYLARADARRLLIVGAGRVAALIAAAMQAVRPIDEVIVWNHHHARAEELAATLEGDGIAARASADLAASVRAADIVSCATLSTRALIEGDWLAPGTHLDLIGSFTPQMREADPRCFARARVFVDTEEALAKAGDVLDATAAGSFAPQRLQGTLGALCGGHCAGRSGPDEITLFKAVGNALEDLAAAELVYEGLSAGAARA